MISVQFQGKPFNIIVIQVYALTSNAENVSIIHEPELPDVQAGFRKGRGARDQIPTLRKREP